MRALVAAGLLAVVCLAVYCPHKNAEFVLDDYYTVVRNPLIKNPSLFSQIWTSHLFDAHQSSGYIKFGYYRPLLESSWVLDYRLFGLKAWGYQWINLLIHAFNCFLLYILWCRLFGQNALALKASLLFCVLPAQEWVVRYVTGRGDELSVLFALLALFFLVGVLKKGEQKGYILVLVFWASSALTREVALTYILYAFLIYFCLKREFSVRLFSWYWLLIGLIPFLALFPIIPKQGNILTWHVFYFASAGLCLWLAQGRLRLFVILFILFTAASLYQGRFWTTEESLLRHTRQLEFWPRTVVDQQLLMKYDQDIPAIEGMVNASKDPLIKAMWLRRLGIVYFKKNDLDRAQDYFTQAFDINPANVDTLDALAVVYHLKGQEDESFKYLNQSLAVNPLYPDTLRTMGIYYYIHKNMPQARLYLNHCLFLDPDNLQARQLLGLANKAN